MQEGSCRKFEPAREKEGLLESASSPPLFRPFPFSFPLLPLAAPRKKVLRHSRHGLREGEGREEPSSLNYTPPKSRGREEDGEKQAKKMGEEGGFGGRKMGTFFWVAKEKGMEEEEVARRNIAFPPSPS